MFASRLAFEVRLDRPDLYVDAGSVLLLAFVLMFQITSAHLGRGPFGRTGFLKAHGVACLRQVRHGSWPSHCSLHDSAPRGEHSQGLTPSAHLHLASVTLITGSLEHLGGGGRATSGLGHSRGIRGGKGCMRPSHRRQQHRDSQNR